MIDTRITRQRSAALAQHVHADIMCNMLLNYVSFDEALPTLVPHCLSSYLLLKVYMHLQYLS